MVGAPLGNATLSVNNGPYNLAASMDGKFVYVCNYSANTISILSRNTSTGVLTVANTISANTGPFSIYISSDGLYAYVCSIGASTVTVYSINTTTGMLSVIGSVSTPTPHFITMSTDLMYLYVTSSNNGSISVFNRAADTGLLSFKVSYTGNPNANALAISPDGGTIYLSTSTQLQSATRDNNTGLLQLGTGNFANFGSYDFVITFDGNYIYTTASYLGVYSIGIFNSNLQKLGTIATGNYPIKLCMSRGDSSIYVADYSSNMVSEYSRDTNTGLLTLIGTIATGSAPISIIVSPDGNNVYVSNYSSNSISEYTRNFGTGVLSNISLGYEYTTVLSDGRYVGSLGNVILINNNANTTVSIPNNSIVNYPVGTLLQIEQLDINVLSINPNTGVLINGSSNIINFNTQYSTISLLQISINNWILINSGGNQTTSITTASNIGLGNVNNTSDINKPVSIAQAAADAAVLVTAKAYTDAAIVNLSPSNTVFNTQSGNTYTVALTDSVSGSVLVSNNMGGGLTITIPTNANVMFPIGSTIQVLQLGTGKVTFVGQTGVTVNSPNGLKSIGTQYAAITLMQTSINSWVLIGALQA